MLKNKSVRHSVIAGHWYPGNEKELRQQIAEYLATAKPAVENADVFALIVPHAGYIYSGRTAAHAFKLIEGKNFERVIITSPFHAMAPEGFLTSAHTQYETPLGTVDVDKDGLRELNRILEKHQISPIQAISKEQEHSLEIELPFLQQVLARPFKLLPIMVRTHHPDQLKVLGEAFVELMKSKRTLLVASTDLSHFYTAEIAKTLDERVLQYIEDLSPLGLLAGNEQGRAQACGAGAVAAVLWAAEACGAEDVRILKYTHSGMVTGDMHSVVGYGSAVIYKGNKND